MHNIWQRLAGGKNTVDDRFDDGGQRPENCVQRFARVSLPREAVHFRQTGIDCPVAQTPIRDRDANLEIIQSREQVLHGESVRVENTRIARQQARE